MMHSDEPVEAVAASPRRSELLCFANDKTSSMANDDIVKLITDFYKEDEIIAARDLLDECNPSQRMPRRKGTDRLRATVEDIVKCLLKPNSCPVFYAVDISRLPPVDASHCDVSAILRELSILRNEVRAVSKLRDEVAQLRTLLQMQSQVGSIAKEFTLVKEGNLLASASAQPSPVANPKPLFADMAALLSSEGGMSNIVAKKKVPRKPTIGCSNSNKHVKAVSTTRTVDIFVSRLLPMTTAAELIDSVHSIKSDISVHEVSCHKLASRYKELYSSYHVEIRVNADDIKRALDTFMSPEAWPVGVIVRRYFKPKPKDGSQSEAHSNLV
jgi:hypothetical protein